MNMVMMNIVFLAVVLCLQTQLQLTLSEPTGNKCSDDSNTCACKTDKGTIDLTSVLEPGASPPKFPQVFSEDVSDFSYSYNPCNSFPGSGGECTAEVYACQVPNTDPTDGYAIALDNTEEMYTDTDGKVYVYYHGTGGRETRVDLTCDTTAEPKDLHITTTGDSETQLLYRFVMTGCQVCVGGCSGSPGPGPGQKSGVAVGEVGVVLIVIIPAALIAYFIVGAVIMKVKYQATGSDIVPNKIFWIALPGLVKEGFVFTFGPPFRFIRSKIRGEQGYEAQKDSV